MRKRMKMAGLLVMFILGMISCFTGCGENEQVREEDTETMTVVTSFYPMYVLTLQVTEGVEGMEVVNMAQPQTGCLHDYQLTTADMKILDGADILVINGAGMENFLDKVIEQLPQLQVITATEGMELLEDEHDRQLEHGEETHNPHVWVSPTGAAQEVECIAAGLAAADPAHMEQYQANAQKFALQMEELKDQMQQQLDTLTHRQLVTFHEAFPYFAQEFGLEVVAVVESEPGQEPVASEMDALIETIRTHQIPAIFVETQYADQTARLIADEAGVEVYELDLVVTGDTNQPPEKVREVYREAMQQNLAVLMEALQ